METQDGGRGIAPPRWRDTVSHMIRPGTGAAGPEHKDATAARPDPASSRASSRFRTRTKVRAGEGPRFPTQPALSNSGVHAGKNHSSGPEPAARIDRQGKT